jgi:hypothetical protein
MKDEDKKPTIAESTDNTFTNLGFDGKNLTIGA